MGGLKSVMDYKSNWHDPLILQDNRPWSSFPLSCQLTQNGHGPSGPGLCLDIGPIHVAT